VPPAIAEIPLRIARMQEGVEERGVGWGEGGGLAEADWYGSFGTGRYKDCHSQNKNSKRV